MKDNRLLPMAGVTVVTSERIFNETSEWEEYYRTSNNYRV